MVVALRFSKGQLEAGKLSGVPGLGRKVQGRVARRRLGRRRARVGRGGGARVGVGAARSPKSADY